MPAHLLAIALLFAIAAMPCQAQLNTAPDIEKATKAGFAKAISEFRDFLQVPNDGHYPAQIAANIGWATQAFQSRGFKTQLIETPGAPHVYAEKQFVKKGKTVLFYLQIDGQPVDTSAWDQESPYKAALKEGKNGQWQEIDCHCYCYCHCHCYLSSFKKRFSHSGVTGESFGTSTLGAEVRLLIRPCGVSRWQSQQ